MAPLDQAAFPARDADMDVDVCVVGAGPVGATLACRLQASGVSVAVLDRAALPPMEHPDFDGRAYAIAAGSRRLLAEAGIWDALPLPSCPITGIRVSDGQVGRPASPLFLHFDAIEARAARQGSRPGLPGRMPAHPSILPDARHVRSAARADANRPRKRETVASSQASVPVPDASVDAMGWMVEARSLRVALNRALHDRPGLHLLAPARAEVSRSACGVCATVEGRTVRARLVVSAEGRDSTLREQAGIGVARLPYKQVGLVCAIAHERPHGNVALEHFLPAGPFAQLPMCGIEGHPHVSAIVWTEQVALGRRLLALDEAAFGREVSRRLGGHLGAVRPVGRRWLYPLSALHALRYVDTRLALVGDAAHGIHPIAGQGLNLGFRDVQALSTLVIEAVRRGEDPGGEALLRAYQRQRRPDNLLMLAATDALDRLFSSDNSLLRLVRDLGIAGVHRLPPLKRAFMLRAMGST